MFENKRRKAGGYYLSKDELIEILDSAYDPAIDSASLEVKEGLYELEQLEQLVNKAEILEQALDLLI